MKAIFYGIAIVGGLVAWEAIKGLQTATPASANGVPQNALNNTTTSSALSPTGSLDASSGTTSGTSVGGNLSWILAEAESVAGVAGWDAGLQKVLAQENPAGDPAIQNPIPVGPQGEHATGLFQMLPSTFQANAVTGCGDIVNPLCNTIAAIRYIRTRYGSPSNIPNLGTPAYQGY
jgi:hypothetical protein